MLKLKETREKLGYTIDQVSEALKIRKRYIINLEQGEYDQIPGKVYVVGYSKMYHEFLRLPYLAYDDHIETTHVQGSKVNGSTKLKKYIIIALSILGLVLIFVSYAAYKERTHFEHKLMQDEAY